MSKVLVVLSDLHCGSNVGLSHPEAVMSSGNIVSFGSNIIQQYLWDRWLEARDKTLRYLNGDKATILINGDAVEGVHHRTTELIATTIAEHTGIAIQCLKEWEGLASDWRFIRGTECHTHDMESVIATEFDAPTPKDKLLREFNGCLVDAAHHIGPTARAYLEASQFSITMGNARVNYSRAGQRVPQVFLRAHRHCGGYYSDGSGMLCVTGAWQFLTRHGKKVVTDSISRPSVLILDWRNSEPGELPAIKEFTFNPPQDEIELL